MSRQQRMDRRALFASGAAAALLAATGVSAASLPERGGQLRMALSGGQRSDLFDPRLLAGRSPGLFLQIAMVGTLFETLTEIAADGTLRGELATAWRASEGFTRWEFDLREDARFHDGRAFGSEDVLKLASNDGKLPGSDGRITIVPMGAYRVAFVLDRPDPALPFKLADPQLCILPRDGTAHARENGIGTGPYKLRKYDAGRHLIAERVAQHPKDGRAAWFDRIELVGIEAEPIRAEALREDMVDVADLSDAGLIAAKRGLICLPNAGDMTCAIGGAVALPPQTGTRWALDNLRAPQRWWAA